MAGWRAERAALYSVARPTSGHSRFIYFRVARLNTYGTGERRRGLSAEFHMVAAGLL